MISSINFRKATFLKKLILFLCILSLGALSNVSAKSIVNSNHKLFFDELFQDTVVNINGKIVDSITNVPIPFATITFFKDATNSMTIISTENGTFSNNIKHLMTKVRISAIGYQEQIYELVSNSNNIILLKPVNNTLPNIIVSSKAKKLPNAITIIKKVNKQVEKNYGNFSFTQKFHFFSDIHNYDTLKCKMTDLVNIDFDKNQKKMKAKNWNQDTLYYDKTFLNLIGSPSLVAGDIIPSSDILRKGLAIDDKQRKSFDYKLLAHYKDEKLGFVYLVSFRPNSTFKDSLFVGRTIGGGSMGWGYWNGEMLIREDDYAVVSLKYIWEKPVERTNESLERSYLSKNWKANRLSRIISSSLIFKYEYIYAKDKTLGKYFVQKIIVDSYESGKQIETRRKVQLHYKFEAISLGVEKNDEIYF
jgi:hypothetical protein